MKSGILLACVLALVVQVTPSSAFAAGGTLSGRAGVLGGVLDGLAAPFNGRLGNLTLNSFVLLPKLNLPVLKNGVPVIGSIDFRSYLQTVKAIGILQQPLLPGLK